MVITGWAPWNLERHSFLFFFVIAVMPIRLSSTRVCFGVWVVVCASMYSIRAQVGPDQAVVNGRRLFEESNPLLPSLRW